jgi:Papain-like cysteine protease AvrRpt2
LASGSAFGQIHKYQLLQYNDPQVSSLSEPQYYDHWCWAACIAMAFRSQNVNVTQYQIVRYIKHSLVNQGAAPSEIAAAFTNHQGQDQNADFYNSNALLLERTSLTTFSMAGQSLPADQLGPLFAFMLGHGVPTLMTYVNPGGQSGHCVFISGITLEEQGNNVTTLSYQIEDPWPLDSAGRPISAGHAIRKTLDASQIQSVPAFIIPLVFSSFSVNHMQQFLSDANALMSHPPQSLSDMDHLMSNRVKITNESPNDTGGPSTSVLSFRSAISRALSAVQNNDPSIRGALRQQAKKYSFYSAAFNVSGMRTTEVTATNNGADQSVKMSTDDNLSHSQALNIYERLKSDILSVLGAKITDTDDHGEDCVFNLDSGQISLNIIPGDPGEVNTDFVTVDVEP